MRSLYDFLTEDDDAPLLALPVPSAESGGVPIQALDILKQSASRVGEAVESLPAEKASALTKHVTQLVQSERFLRELSDRVARPLEGESEDAFVQRAKGELRSMLQASLRQRK